MCSCAPFFCGSCVEDVNALSVVHTEASSGMDGWEEGFLPEAASLDGRRREISLIGRSDGEPGGGASQAGAPHESIFAENDG